MLLAARGTYKETGQRDGQRSRVHFAVVELEKQRMLAEIGK